MGNVGGTLAYSLAVRGMVHELVLINRGPAKAEAHAADLNHGLCHLPHADIRSGGYSDARGADIVFITADAFQGLGPDRLKFAKANTALVREAAPALAEAAPDAVYIVATNPVDVIAHHFLEAGKLRPSQVLSTGTVLDTARLRFLIARHCGVSSRDVQGYVLGEHGETAFIAWSTLSLGGSPMASGCSACGGSCGGFDRDAVTRDVREAGWKVLSAKGATTFAICESMIQIADAVLRDANSVLTVSSLLQGYNGVSGVFLSVPTLVGREGVRSRLPLRLSGEEQAAFELSARTVRKILEASR